MRLSSLLPAIGLSTLLTVPLIAAPDGVKLYEAKCLVCHGEGGKGTVAYEEPLIGKLAKPQLAEVIRKTMPGDDPGTLSAEEASALAEYIHGAFYFQNEPVRTELARLTVPQYRQSVADLVGSFRWTPGWKEERGLKAEYFKSRRADRRRKAADRIDPQIDFDFGTEAPLPDKEINPLEFSIQWQGSVLAPETGEYEILIRTDHAAKLWLNDNRTPLIDAYVKSGDQNEYTATIYLIGGRLYPLRMEFSKANQGVNNDQNNAKFTPKRAFVSLLWKRPRSVPQPIPPAYLFPDSAPESFVCATAFPPDDRSYGWERGTTVSKAWDEATTDAALETVTYISARLNELAKTRDDDPERAKKLREFASLFAERAFRRPLSEELKQVYVETQFQDGDPEQAVKRVVLLTLKSPRFLYHRIEEPDQYDVAARLSLAVWNSLPDNQLLDAAKNGWLKTDEQIRQQVQRMLNDPRARIRMREFLLTWLQLDQPHDMEKNLQVYPEFSPEIAADMRTSLELFLDQVLWSDSADFRQLLLSREIPLNDRLAKFYGIDRQEKSFAPASLDQEQRAGVLTHPFLLTRLAHADDTSPIHRGVFVARGLLGVGLKPPPDAVVPIPASLHPGLTTRERVILQTKGNSCMGCHTIINPLGFTLENFDAVGRFRREDRSKPVDPTGGYLTREGDAREFQSARELAEFIAASPEAHEAFVEKMFHNLIQQPMRAYGDQTKAELTETFRRQNYNIRQLTAALITRAALFNPRESQVTTGE